MDLIQLPNPHQFLNHSINFSSLSDLFHHSISLEVLEHTQNELISQLIFGNLLFGSLFLLFLFLLLLNFRVLASNFIHSHILTVNL